MSPNEQQVTTAYEGKPFSISKLTERTQQELINLTTQTVFVRNSRESSSDSDKYLFTLTRKGLVSQRHVGVILTSDGTLIEILPKIYRNGITSDQEARSLLCNLLSHSGIITFRKANSASLASQKGTLLEVFNYAFLVEVQTLLRHGLRCDYIDNSSNLSYKKGRIHFPTHIKKNVTSAHKLYCTFQEYAADCVENQLLVTALAKVARITTSSANKKLAQLLLRMLEHITELSNVMERDFKKCRSDRYSIRYNPALTLAKLILLSPPTPKSGNNNTTAILFDMAMVFEKAVEATFKNSQAFDQVECQQCIPWFEKLYSPKPDFILHGNQKIIADAKWKNLENNTPSKQDQYQLFSYMQATNADLSLLIFPSRFPNKTVRQFSLKLGQQTHTIALVPFCLHTFKIMFPEVIPTHPDQLSSHSLQATL